MAALIPFLIAFVSGGFSAVGAQHLMDPTVAAGFASVIGYGLGRWAIKTPDPKAK